MVDGISIGMFVVLMVLSCFGFLVLLLKLELIFILFVSNTNFENSGIAGNRKREVGWPVIVNNQTRSMIMLVSLVLQLCTFLLGDQTCFGIAQAFTDSFVYVRLPKLQV